MKVLEFYIIVTALCGFFATMYAMDERAIVPVREMRDCEIPISFIRTYVQSFGKFKFEVQPQVNFH